LRTPGALLSPAGRYFMRLADQIRAMGHGDHVCLIYSTLAEPNS
jgi:hypothetical protein